MTATATEYCYYCNAPGHRLSAHSVRARVVFDVEGTREITYIMEHCPDCERYRSAQWVHELLVGKSRVTKRLADFFIEQQIKIPLWKVARLYELKWGVSLGESTTHDVITKRKIELYNQKRGIK